MEVLEQLLDKKGKVAMGKDDIHSNNSIPDIIQILPIGYVSSQKGNFMVDSESYALINKRMKSRNIDIVIDYEHQTLGNEQAPASGWIKKLILKSDGIYAYVEWTENAKEYLKNKEYRYLSPVVIVRNNDKKAIEIHSVALTNSPAINGATAIINSNKPSLIQEKSLDSDTKKILYLLNIKEEDYNKYK